MLFLEKLNIIIRVLFGILFFRHLLSELTDCVASEYRILELDFIVFTSLIASRPSIPFIFSLGIGLLIAVGVSFIIFCGENLFILPLGKVNFNTLLG